MIRPEERLIVALDVDSLEKASQLVKGLLPLGIKHFKVGLSLYTLAGPAAIDAVHKEGGKVFLDLKFHDIPNTVAKAVQFATRLSVWMMNLHIQGGSAMMREALRSLREEAKRQGKTPPLLIGVTVLTSMAERDFADLGLRKTLKDQVLYLAKLAQSAGLNGIVASAKEASAVRWAMGKDFLIVAPGIRKGTTVDPFSAPPLAVSGTVSGSRQVPDTALDDQRRSATATEAIKAGVDYLVVGRPILEAPDPVAAARELLKEIPT